VSTIPVNICDIAVIKTYRIPDFVKFKKERKSKTLLIMEV
jgi:hypothetical protein